jgi:hypothetical protein
MTVLIKAVTAAKKPTEKMRVSLMILGRVIMLLKTTQRGSARSTTSRHVPTMECAHITWSSFSLLTHFLSGFPALKKSLSLTVRVGNDSRHIIYSHDRVTLEKEEEEADQSHGDVDEGGYPDAYHEMC